jgi:hypothetical protein
MVKSMSSPSRIRDQFDCGSLAVRKFAFRLSPAGPATTGYSRQSITADQVADAIVGFLFPAH